MVRNVDNEQRGVRLTITLIGENFQRDGPFREVVTLRGFTYPWTSQFFIRTVNKHADTHAHGNALGPRQSIHTVLESGHVSEIFPQTIGNEWTKIKEKLAYR